MSWQSYVDTNLVGTGSVSRAAIYGLEGGVWAASPNFALTGNEHAEIVGGFSEPNGILASGVHIAGEKYLTLRADDRSIYGKKNATGFCIVKTSKAVLIALYDDKIQPGNCAKVTEGFADYLISVGY